MHLGLVPGAQLPSSCNKENSSFGSGKLDRADPVRKTCHQRLPNAYDVIRDIRTFLCRTIWVRAVKDGLLSANFSLQTFARKDLSHSIFALKCPRIIVDCSENAFTRYGIEAIFFSCFAWSSSLFIDFMLIKVQLRSTKIYVFVLDSYQFSWLRIF